DTHVALARLDGHEHDPQRGGAGGARIGHVVDGDAGLADLLLDALTDAGVRLVEASGRHDVHVLHGHLAVVERGGGRLAGQVDEVLVLVALELGHRDPEDPHVIAHRRASSRSWWWWGWWEFVVLMPSGGS